MLSRRVHSHNCSTWGCSDCTPSPLRAYGGIAACGPGVGEAAPLTQPPLSAGQRPAEGLYDPRHEHDACGVGFVVDIEGRKSHAIVRQALAVLINPPHPGG